MATIKLNKETKEPAYRRFVSDQVLTATQLNDVVDHFERQDSLSRVCLSGVGIVCGLQVKYTENTSVEVTKGCAVTTDGDLISFEGATYTGAKVFEDSEAKYERFIDIPILELKTATNAEESGVEIIGKVSNLANMVVILYLEYYSKDETPCTSSDCDTQGQEQAAKIRVLLMNKENVKTISNKDNDPIFDKFNNTKKYIDLPEIAIRRIILQNSYITNANGEDVISQNSNTADYAKLKESYRKVIQDTGVLAQLKNGVDKLFTDFGSLIGTDSLKIKSANINKGIDNLFDFNVKNIPIDVQYRFDLLLDLLDTYNEIKQLIFDLRATCCPERTAFPKHVLLGELEPTETYVQFRHDFYPAPIIPHGTEKLKKIKSLLLRFHLMVTEYDIPQSTASLIKVTPSKKCDKTLGNRSIPYYYGVTTQLVENWDYEKTRKFAAGDNLGYRTENLAKRDAVQNPLDYDICANGFYRIEGHLGKDYRTALADLDVIKSEKGLPFEIKVLSIDETLDSIDPADYECEFDDLNTVLKAWRAEQNCLNASISKFFSGFSLKEQGAHKYYTLNNARVVSEVTSTAEAVKPKITIKTTNTGNIGTLLQPRTSLISGLKLDVNALNANFKNLVYKRDTVIEDNLKTDEDVLGKFIDKAIKEKPEGSAVDIASIVKTEVDKDPQMSGWDAEVRKVAIDQPYEILAYTKVATRFIPNNVSEMNVDRIGSYEATVEDLCDRVESFKKNMTSLLFNKDSKYVRRGYEEQYALLLNQLSVNCCAAEKMKVLFEEIEERKKRILEQKLLSKFVEKHAGLEHKAGVEPGGTFVMVYKGKNRATKSVANLTDLLTRSNISINPIKNYLDKGTLGKTTGREEIDFLNTELQRRFETGELKELNTELQDAFLFRPTANVTENTVVADFALPYMCCSDCSPVAFIVPKATVSLRLPKDFVCLGDESTPLAFEVSPADGVVAADVGEGLVGGVEQTDGKFFFNASLLSEELLGQEIKFTVNGQFTDAKITVFREPVFDFTFSEPRFFKNNAIALVNFTSQIDELSQEVTYFWDFGDDTLPDNNTDENPRHEYQLDFSEKNVISLTVTLTVTNGKCSHSETHDIVFEPEIVAETCIEETQQDIIADNDSLSKFNEISTELRKIIYNPTSALYKEVIENSVSFLSGKLNDDLNNLFGNLMETTAGSILERSNSQDTKVFSALLNIYRLQIQLFYSILCCQPKDRIEKIAKPLDAFLKGIEDTLTAFEKNKIKIDETGELKDFLNTLLEKVTDLGLLVDHFKKQLELL